MATWCRALEFNLSFSYGPSVTEIIVFRHKGPASCVFYVVDLLSPALASAFPVQKHSVRYASGRTNRPLTFPLPSRRRMNYSDQLLRWGT